jgi:hypothetical protein
MGLEGENLQSGLYGDASPRPEAKHRVGGVSSDSAAAVLNSIRRRPDCLAEDADRSETVSAGRIPLQFAICREFFRNCRESRSYCLPSFLIVSRSWKDFSPT